MKSFLPTQNKPLLTTEPVIQNLELREGERLYDRGKGINDLKDALKNDEPSDGLKRFLFTELGNACQAGESEKIIKLLGIKSGMFTSIINDKIEYQLWP